MQHDIEPNRIPTYLVLKLDSNGLGYTEPFEIRVCCVVFVAESHEQ
jgi:hypothetical protein